MLQAWLLLPALLAALSLGCGLLVDRLAGSRMPGVLLLPLGLAAIVVLARACTTLDATASLATPLVVVAALVGFAAGRRRLSGARLDRWAAVAALAVFAVYGAPAVLSGSPTFAGYTVLGDTAVHFALIDRIMDSGTNVDGLPPSAYQETLRSYFASGYPLGGHAALGAVRPLAGIDVAWAFQPFLAFVAAMLSLTIAGLLLGTLREHWKRAAVAALAAQPALVYSFALQGSIKELITLWLIPLFVALVPVLAAAPERRAADGDDRGFLLGDLVPLMVASAAAVASVGVAILPWLGPVLLVALVIVARHRPRSPIRVVGLALAFAAGLALVSLPTLLDLDTYLRVTRKVVTAQQEFGNLLQPLGLLQTFGIWLQGDYRLLPVGGGGLSNLNLTYVLIGVAAVAGLLGLGLLVRRLALAPLLYVFSSLIALWYVTRTGSPWADGKALAIASPAVLLLAALGVVALDELGARFSAVLVAVALAGGVVVSNAMAYHDVSLAPHDRLEELARVGEMTRGDGPTLYTEFEEFAKHFLRDSQPVGASEALGVPGLSPHLRGGGGPRFGFGTATERLAQRDVSRFRTLVVRRSPADAPPPADFRRIWRGRWYEIWRRDEGRTVLGHVAVRTVGRRQCARVHELARRAARGDGALVAARRPALAGFQPATAALPPGWGVRTDDPTLVGTLGPGAVSGVVTARHAGSYEVWISGSFGRRVAVRMNGRETGSVEDELGRPPGWQLVGRAALRRGRNRIELVRSGGDLEPGNGDGPRFVGPLTMRGPSGEAGTGRVDPTRWRSLCRPPVAWVELVAPSG